MAGPDIAPLGSSVVNDLRFAGAAQVSPMPSIAVVAITVAANAAAMGRALRASNGNTEIDLMLLQRRRAIIP